METTAPDAGPFLRARSTAAKQARETAILAAARALGERDGIRRVTLTDIADAVGMHKSAMLRYFETREQIFLRITAAGWQEWADEVVESLATGRGGATGPARHDPADVAAVLARTLVARPVFCDLLAQAPLNLERNVSLDGVREFKLPVLGAVARIAAAVRGALPGLGAQDAGDAVAAATSLAGALWQMATPSAEVRRLYESDPRLAHAVVDVEPRVARMLTAMLLGFLGPADRH